ncbi:nuclear transport factor 2 family protein [Streptomyces aurantiogriseus]|uniref:Ketosteroid isomerase n=1 Tax=Streptomyces aurantiogriseus TaxID=66870 RepID=A0A918FKI2_9ACTN|nr:nuclear transport factor 2 family protein [Streptomyces aurantiogriseus]GGR47447.1 ketosteroid isomerase [Streptomyces aurantiogriseus]
MSGPVMPPAVLRFFQASQNRDAEAWSGAFAEDAFFHDPVGTPPLEGRAAVRDLVVSVITGFSPFLGLTPTEAHIAGDSVAVTWHGAAITRDRRPVNWSGISVFELDDTGRIREARAYFDRAAFQAQVDGG